MTYRTVDLKDLPKQQKQFYREMKSRYSLGTGNTGYKTEQDMKDYVKRRYEEAQASLSVLRSSDSRVMLGPKARANDLWLKCKICKKIFELKVP